MSETLTANSQPGAEPKPLTFLQELEKQKKEVQEKMRNEKRRIKSVRLNKKESAHVLMILGSIIDRAGKENIAPVLEKADFLKAEDKLAVEYYYGLRERPATSKKTAGVPSNK